MNRKPRVILFDDDQAIIRFLKKQLAEKECNLFTYEDPSHCPLQHSHECKCCDNELCADIVVTDIDMPKVSGLDFVEAQLAKGCNIQHIAVMSGSWSEEDAERARNLGCKVLEKPYILLPLMEWLEKCLEDLDLHKVLSSWFLEEKLKT